MRHHLVAPVLFAATLMSSVLLVTPVLAQAGSANACSLVTAEEVSAALGTPVTANEMSPEACVFAGDVAAGSLTGMTVFLVRGAGAAGALEQTRAQAPGATDLEVAGVPALQIAPETLETGLIRSALVVQPDASTAFMLSADAPASIDVPAAVVGLAGIAMSRLDQLGPPPSAPEDQGSVGFRIATAWDFPQNPDYEYFSFSGSASVDGSLPIAVLRDEPVGMLSATPTWSQRWDQAIEMFDSATCAVDQLTLDCGRCVETYRSTQPARTDLRILARTADSVDVWVLPVTELRADDPSFRDSACVGDSGGVVYGFAGFPALRVTFDLSGDTPVPTTVVVDDEVPAGYGIPFGASLALEPLP